MFSSVTRYLVIPLQISVWNTPEWVHWYVYRIPWCKGYIQSNDFRDAFVARQSASLNHFIQTKSLRTIPFPRIIELTPINKRAFIMHRYYTVETWCRTVSAFLQYPIKYAARQFLDSFCRTQLLQKLFVLQFIFFLFYSY